MPLFLICVSFHGGVEQGGEKKAAPFFHKLVVPHVLLIGLLFEPHSKLFARGIKTKNEEEVACLREWKESTGFKMGVGGVSGKWWYGDLAGERVTHCFSV